MIGNANSAIKGIFSPAPKVGVDGVLVLATSVVMAVIGGAAFVL